MTTLLRSFASSEKLRIYTRGNATDCPINRKTNPPTFPALHHARVWVSSADNCPGCQKQNAKTQLIVIGLIVMVFIVVGKRLNTGSCLCCRSTQGWLSASMAASIDSRATSHRCATLSRGIAGAGIRTITSPSGRKMTPLSRAASVT
jgi:hypothetical protein